MTTSQPGGLSVVEGFASEQTATVWLISEDQGVRLPAMLMSLEEVGLEGSAFLGILPADMRVTHVMAVAFNGQVLETYELP